MSEAALREVAPREVPPVEAPLAIASLFDADFSIDWIVELSGAKASKVLLALEEGIRDGLLTRAGQEFFSFADLVRRQQLRETLPPDAAAHLHRRISQVLRRDLPECEGTSFAVTHHLLRTSGDAEACRWLLEAGDAHLRGFRPQDALACFSKTLENLADRPGDEEDRLFIEGALRYSKASTASGNTAEILRILEAALGKAERRGDAPSQARLLMQLAKIQWLRSRYPVALQHFERASALAETLGDQRLIRSADNFRLVVYFWQGRFRDVVRTSEGLDPEVAQLPRGQFPVTAALTVGRCYVHTGSVSQGLGMLDAIHALCVTRGDRYLASHARFTIGATMLDLRRIDEAIAALSEARRMAEETGNEWVLILGSLVLAYAHHLNGNAEQAIRNLEECLRHSRRTQVSVQPYPFMLELTWAMELGTLPRVRGLSLAAEIARMIAGQNVYTAGVAYRYQAMLKCHQGQPFQACWADLETSLEHLERAGHQISIALTIFEMARLCRLHAREAEAREHALRAAKCVEPFGPALIPEDLRPLTTAGPSSREKRLLDEILNLGQELVTIRDNKLLPQQIISAATRITGAERGAIFLCDGGEGSPGGGCAVTLRASRNLTAEHVAEPMFEPSMRMIRAVISSGKGLVEGVDRGAAATPGLIRSRICVPMTFRGRVVGILYLDNRVLSSAFEPADLGLLAYFAAQAALALDNASAYERIQAFNLRLENEKEYYQEEHLQELRFDRIIGDSEPVRQVLRQAQLVSTADSTVLITGETGVGKELVAWAIHQMSARKDKPFIRVNTCALPENLIASELFGHEKGAFTGAAARHVGRFELANGGTLFLDEIGEISSELQAKLLRVLQSKEFERVGGTETIRSDFRLIVATNRDLRGEVGRNRFRADLYYRLNVFPIAVPPLRERKRDIPLLAEHFLRIYSARLGRRARRFPEVELNKLVAYDWPGNIRELENVIERGVILSAGIDFRCPELGPTEAVPAAVEAEPASTDLVTLAENEKRHIIAALEKCGWKVRGRGGAAELLGLNPSTLAFRMKKLGVQRPPA